MGGFPEERLPRLCSVARKEAREDSKREGRADLEKQDTHGVFRLLHILMVQY